MCLDKCSTTPPDCDVFACANVALAIRVTQETYGEADLDTVVFTRSDADDRLWRPGVRSAADSD